MKEGILRKIHLRSLLVIISIIMGLVVINNSSAYDLPGVNLGLTSFLDGGPPSGPGFYFTQYFDYYRSTELTNDKGKAMLPSAADEKLDVFISFTQFLYWGKFELFPGVRPAIDFIIPIIAFDLDQNLPIPLQDNGAGVGDILIGPMLQWDPIMLGNNPFFVQRIEFQMLLPTGKYDSDRELNPGSNFFSFNPYWSATLFPAPRWEISWRIHYLWNAKNNDPNREFKGADDTQAGQAIHFNLATSYEILEKRLRVGLNGYYLKQITDTEVDGKDVPNRREQVLGIGPGIILHCSQDTHFLANFYVETEAENRPEGYRLNLRLVHHF